MSNFPHRHSSTPKQIPDLTDLTVVVKHDFSGENVVVQLRNTHNARCAIRANNVGESWWLTFSDYKFRGYPEEFPNARVLEFVRVHESVLGG
jgi:hypothetical protein